MDHGHRQWFSHNNNDHFFWCQGVHSIRFREVEFGNSANHELNLRADDEANPGQKQWSAGRLETSARSNVSAAESCEVIRTADVGGKDWISQCQKVADEQGITHGGLDL